eukprot:g16602.t1
MDTSPEPATTQRGRQTKTPAKYKNLGSLGAAVGGGGLLSGTPNPLPGFTGSAQSGNSSTGGASAINRQSESGVGGSRRVAPTASAFSNKGKGKAGDRSAEVDAILNDARFDPPDAGSGEESGVDRVDVNAESSDSGGESVASSSDDEGEDSQPRRGRGPGPAHGRGAGAGRSSASRGSSPGESTAKDMRQLQASLKRHKGKDYNKWAAYLLKEACALRKIAGFSKSKDVEKMG